jgi:hypothetical protein
MVSEIIANLFQFGAAFAAPRDRLPLMIVRLAEMKLRLNQSILEAAKWIECTTPTPPSIETKVTFLPQYGD